MQGRTIQPPCNSQIGVVHHGTWTTTSKRVYVCLRACVRSESLIALSISSLSLNLWSPSLRSCRSCSYTWTELNSYTAPTHRGTDVQMDRQTKPNRVSSTTYLYLTKEASLHLSLYITKGQLCICRGYGLQCLSLSAYCRWGMQWKVESSKTGTFGFSNWLWCLDSYSTSKTP